RAPALRPELGGALELLVGPEPHVRFPPGRHPLRQFWRLEVPRLPEAVGVIDEYLVRAAVAGQVGAVGAADVGGFDTQAAAGVGEVECGVGVIEALAIGPHGVW